MMNNFKFDNKSQQNSINSIIKLLENEDPLFIDFVNKHFKKLDPNAVAAIHSSSKEGEYLPDVIDRDIFPKKAGVYVICIKDGTTEPKYYVGSTNNFLTRFSNHYRAKSTSTLHRKFHELGGMSKLQWFPVYYTTNYIEQFKIEHPDYKLSSKQVTILKGFGSFVTRTIEQAFIEKLQPSLNDMLQVHFRKVVFPPVKWAREVILFKKNDVNQTPFYFESINSACESLGIDRITAYQTMKKYNRHVISKVLNEPVRFVDPNLPELLPPAPKKAPVFGFYKPHKLPLDTIYAFNTSGKVVAKFYSLKDAANQCGLPFFQKVNSNANLKYIRCVYKGEEMDILFGINRDST